jgi:hypothetical protein
LAAEAQVELVLPMVQMALRLFYLPHLLVLVRETLLLQAVVVAGVLHQVQAQEFLVVLVAGQGLILHPEERVILLLHHQAKVIMEVMATLRLEAVVVLVELDLLVLEMLLVVVAQD